MEKMGWIYRLCRWALGVIFIYAGGTKLLEPEIFAVLIEAYGIVPEILLMPVAIGLPLIEVTAGTGLLFDIRGSLAWITGLLVLFITVLGYGIWMGLDVDCGCFGPEDPESEAFHGLRLSLYRDLFMMAGVIFIYGWRRNTAIRPAGVMTIVNQLLGKRRKENAHG
ncbi:MAG: MauE/DoxX family redox-associated membrane protein [Desulfobacteraceae bacterium]